MRELKDAIVKNEIEDRGQGWDDDKIRYQICFCFLIRQEKRRRLGQGDRW